MPRNPDGSYSRTAGDVAIPLTTIESEDHHNVPHEDFKSMFDLVFWRDGLVAMTGKLILWRDGVEPLEAVSLRQVQAFVDDLQGQIDAIEIGGVPPAVLERITNLETAVSDLTTRVTAIESAITDIQAAISNLQTAVNNMLEAINLLDQRVDDLETRATAVEGRVSALEAQEVASILLTKGIFNVPLYSELPGGANTASPFRIPDLNGVLGSAITLTDDQKAKTGFDKIEWFKCSGAGNLLVPDDFSAVAIKLTLTAPVDKDDAIVEAAYVGGNPYVDQSGTSYYANKPFMGPNAGFNKPVLPLVKARYLPAAGETFTEIYVLLVCSVQVIQLTTNGSGIQYMSPPIQLRLRNGSPPDATTAYSVGDVARTDKLITNGNAGIRVTVRRNAKNASSIVI